MKKSYQNLLFDRSGMEKKKKKKIMSQYVTIKLIYFEDTNV